MSGVLLIVFLPAGGKVESSGERAR
jgi:hypothetical protein